MKLFTKTSLVFCSALLASCATVEEFTDYGAKPVSRPCEKLDALIKEYDNNFDPIKQQQVSSRFSNIWTAKYNLVGNDCQVWSWGNDSTTYACSTSAPNKEVAETYYQNAGKTARQCLDASWTMKESARARDEGMKTEFTQTDGKITISTHMVPTGGLFKSEWTVYYYIGNARKPISD